MNIAIFGAKNEAIYINQQLTGLYPHLHTTKCFIDNNPELTGNVIEGLPIVSFNQFIEDYRKDIDAVIIAVRSSTSLISIVEQLRKSGAIKIGCVLLSANHYNKKFIIDEFGNSNLILWLDETNKPILPQLEANIVDECNLKCKGCSHFSNLFGEKSHYDIDRLERDLSQIAANCYISALYLLGGEPLLCNNLSKYVDLARRILPQSDITIVTNGLLVFEQPDKLYDSIRNNNVQLRISPYKPTIKIKDKIADFLSSKGVFYSFGIGGNDETILKFSKVLSNTHDSDPAKSMSVCSANSCRFLRNGKIYKCPVEGMLYKFLDTYNIDSDLKRGFDIYNVSDWNKVIDELQSPVAACRYCSETMQLMDWEVSAKPDIQDWIVVQ